MNYRQALDVLDRRGNEVQGINLGLQRMITLMRAMGDPQDKVPAIHIAGTNGKGSVAAMAESILRTSGLRTGLYTSPHLIRIEERIRVDGLPISTRKLARAIDAVTGTEAILLRRRGLDRPLTFFELITACAFLHFAEEKPDVAVIEVGLGGALDATNIITPRACVITGISLDHQNILGKTVTRIAREKAGIIKPGVPVISGCRQTAVRGVVGRRAAACAAPLTEIDRDCRITIGSERNGRFTIDLRTPEHRYGNLFLALAGKHQIRNAALAVAAVEIVLAKKAGPAAVREGLARARWPGRLDEYPAKRKTLLDGAHNLEGAMALRDFLRSRRCAAIHLVFGILRDKDVRRIAAALFPLAARIHLTPVANSRSALPGEIAAMRKRFMSRIQPHTDSCAALRAAWRSCPRNGLVVVAGSLYLIGELLPLVKESTRRREGNRPSSRSCPEPLRSI